MSIFSDDLEPRYYAKGGHGFSKSRTRFRDPFQKILPGLQNYTGISDGGFNEVAFIQDKLEQLHFGKKCENAYMRVALALSGGQQTAALYCARYRHASGRDSHGRTCAALDPSQLRKSRT